MKNKTIIILACSIIAIVIIAIAAIAILGVVAVPLLSGRTEEARVAIAKSDINTAIYTALKLYELDNGDSPTTEQGLNALVSKPSLSPVPDNWKGPYLEKEPIDPWNHPYRYTYLPKESHLKISSSGRDGINGTADDIEQVIKTKIPVAISKEDIPGLVKDIESAVSSNVEVTSLSIKENGEFRLSGKTKGLKAAYVFAKDLEDSNLFERVKTDRATIKSPEDIAEFELSGTFVGNPKEKDKISEGLNILKSKLEKEVQ